MLPDSILNAVENDDQLPNNTFFGDGTPISKEEIEEIKEDIFWLGHDGEGLLEWDRKNNTKTVFENDFYGHKPLV